MAEYERRIEEKKAKSAARARIRAALAASGKLAIPDPSAASSSHTPPAPHYEAGVVIPGSAATSTSAASVASSTWSLDTQKEFELGLHGDPRSTQRELTDFGRYAKAGDVVVDGHLHFYCRCHNFSNRSIRIAVALLSRAEDLREFLVAGAAAGLREGEAKYIWALHTKQIIN